MKNKKFVPKCIHKNRQMAFTSTGFLVPCCWIDSPVGRNDPVLSKFYESKWHIDNNDSIEDILNGDLYKEWWHMLKNNPSNAPNYCKYYCTTKPESGSTKKIIKISDDELYKKQSNLKTRIICAKWGEKYNDNHISNLKYMIDTYSGITYDKFEIIDKNLFDNMYNKLQMFDLFRDHHNIYFDLDNVIYKKVPNLYRKNFTLLYDWWREPYHTPLNSSIISWTGDVSYIWKKFISNKDFYFKKYPKSIDEFFYKEIDYETFDKISYSIKEHQYDTKPLDDFSICTFGQMQHLFEKGWTGWWTNYLNKFKAD